MNKFYTVFLAAILTAGATIAKDSVAENVARETISNPEFLTKQDPFVDQVKKEVLRTSPKSALSEIMAPKTAPEDKSTTRKMLEETGGIVKNTMEKMVDYVTETGKNAVKEAKSELPGAVKKAKEMGESMAKTFMKYMKKMMSLITNSFKKMMGKDDPKAQKTYTNDDEIQAAVTRNDESGRYQEIKDPNQEKRQYKAMLDTLSQDG